MSKKVVAVGTVLLMFLCASCGWIEVVDSSEREQSSGDITDQDTDNDDALDLDDEEGGESIGEELETASTVSYNGEILSQYESDDGTLCVLKFKIEHILTNEMTIGQNYHNVDKFIRLDGGSEFDEIQYWAVADMSSGAESKVISFTLYADLIQAVNDQTVVATDLGDYVDDLWVHQSLTS